MCLLANLGVSLEELVEDHLPVAGGVPRHRPRLDRGLAADLPVLVHSLVSLCCTLC